MDTEKTAQRVGLVNWVVLLVCALVSELVARHASSATGQVGVVFLGLGFLVAVLSYFQMRLEERERLEGMELEEMLKSKRSAGLFATAEAESFPARRARQQFEKFFVPAFTLVLLLAQANAVYWLWKWLPTAAPPRLEVATLTMALYAVFALVLFLLGKYAAGLAKLDRQRLLRPGAAYMLLGAFICFIVAVTQAAAWFEFPKLDVQVAYALVVVIGLAAVETLINLVLELYRPRVKGAAARPLYESRVIGLLGQPGGLVTTVAQALDYQFGFKVSETWFYRFLERAFAWLVLIQLGVLWLSTMFVFVGPNEQVLVERLGRPVAALAPGPHFKLPWPLSKSYRFPAGEVQSFTIGAKHEPAHEAEDSAENRVVLWTRRHYEEEFNFLVASRQQPAATAEAPSTGEAIPVNLLSGSIPVQYVVKDLRAWTYHHADPAALLERIATREVTRYLASVDLDQVMGAGRQQAAKELQAAVQQQADAAQLGVDIVFVGLQDMHPPVGGGRETVAQSFEAVIGAAQEREAKIHTAQGEAAELIPQARAEAAERVGRAHGEAAHKIALRPAIEQLFRNQLAAYQKSPAVFVSRTYLDAVAEGLAPAQKVIVTATNASQVITLDLQETVARRLYEEVTVGEAERR
jgi:regulator of protease activity HflC (stomatin/prohibitin superfamily)